MKTEKRGGVRTSLTKKLSTENIIKQLKFTIMAKFVTYQREAQFTSAIETYTGVYNLEESAKHNGYVEIYHPIINNAVMMGIYHTNAFNIVEIPEIIGLNLQGNIPL